MIAVLTDFLVEEERMIIMATHAYEDVEMLADGVIFYARMKQMLLLI